MLLRSNAHTHTTFCDGKNTPEEMILAAIDRGFVSLGFSIHAYTPYEGDYVSPEKEKAYLSEIPLLREKYADHIEILMGIESDSLCDRSYDGFEYRIDSTHYIRHNGELMAIDYSETHMREGVEKLFGGDYLAYCRAYYDQVRSSVSASNAQILGHIDLVTKYNEGGKWFDELDPKYLDLALDTASLAIDRGLVIEVNTGAISRGYRTSPYPNPAILKYIRERNGEIMINSDCHSADAIDTAFDQSIALVKSCGFDHVLRLRKTGFEAIDL